MANIVLFDPAEVRQTLLPLTFTRPVADLRVGILTLAEKWHRRAPEGTTFSWRVDDPALQVLYPELIADEPTIFIAGNVVADNALAEAVFGLEYGHALLKDGRLVAYNTSADNNVEYPGEIDFIDYPTDIFGQNGKQLRADFTLLTAGRASQPLDSTCRLIGEASNLFIEEGAVMLDATINTTTGPVYIGQESEVTEGCVIRGPFALGEHSRLNLGAKVWPDSSIGPHCRVGGEINNIVMWGYSNKAHDGFLGNAVIGQWCNIGAGCVASNLKNNYAKIRLWDYSTSTFRKTDLQFCGLIMGDHSKAGINVMFNTATVVGVGCNVYGAGFPRTFVPSFQEGGAATGFKRARLEALLDTARTVMGRRNRTLTPGEIGLLTELYHRTEK